MHKPAILVVALLLLASTVASDENGGDDTSWWPDETGHHHFAWKGKPNSGFTKGTWYGKEGGKSETAREKDEAALMKLKITRAPAGRVPRTEKVIALMGEATLGRGDFYMLAATYWKAIITLGVFLGGTLAVFAYKFLTAKGVQGDESVPVSPSPAPPQLKESMAARLRSPHDAQLAVGEQRSFNLLF
eukprot:TRINITY_DN1923_c0_g3_i1.p1 TRINITY_DN1923_c0_g3~~TRINITY_DN1923_c0_g3_i1.p1  ORF type:complete len:188 (+),score=21.62 TRINITY_DN1923_c0_g3_i1:71-634(+)